MDSPFRTTSEYLIVPSRATLPQRCVHTNIEVSDHNYKICEIPYIPRWLLPLMLIASPIPSLLVVPMMHKDHSRLGFGLSATIRRKYLFRKVIATCIILTAFLAPVPLAIWLDSTRGNTLAALLFAICFYGGFAFLAFKTSPLKVIRVEGELLWIKGCSPEFLASLTGPSLQAAQ